MNTILNRISDALIAGDRVELRGFGVFSVTERGERTGRNPATGEAVVVETKRHPQFKPGRAMHARLNPSGTVTGAELDAEVERLWSGLTASGQAFVSFSEVPKRATPVGVSLIDIEITALNTTPMKSTERGFLDSKQK